MKKSPKDTKRKANLIDLQNEKLSNLYYKTLHLCWLTTLLVIPLIFSAKSTDGFLFIKSKALAILIFWTIVLSLVLLLQKSNKKNTNNKKKTFLNEFFPYLPELLPLDLPLLGFFIMHIVSLLWAVNHYETAVVIFRQFIVFSLPILIPRLIIKDRQMYKQIVVALIATTMVSYFGVLQHLRLKLGGLVLPFLQDTGLGYSLWYMESLFGGPFIALKDSYGEYMSCSTLGHANFAAEYITTLIPLGLILILVIWKKKNFLEIIHSAAVDFSLIFGIVELFALGLTIFALLFLGAQLPNFLIDILVFLGIAGLYFLFFKYLKHLQKEKAYSFKEFLIKGFPIILTVMFIISILYLLFTGCRGAWVGTAGAFAIMFTVAAYPKVLGIKKILQTLIYGLIGVLLITSVVLVSQPSIRSKMASIVNLDDPPNRFRILVWFSTLEMIKDCPQGLGAENFRLIYPLYRTAQESRQSGFNIGVMQSHNDYLQIISELGIPGCLAFLWLLVTILKMSTQVLTRSMRSSRKLLSLGIVGGILATFGHTVFSFSFQNPASSFSFWWLVGILGYLHSGEMKRFGGKFRKPSFWTVWSVLAVILVGTILQIRPLLADYFHQMGKVSENYKNKKQAVIFYEKGLVLNPYDYDQHLRAANAYNELGNFEMAAKHGEQVIKLHPNYRNGYNDLGVVYDNLGREEEAIQMYNIALKLDPNFPHLHNNLGNIYIKREDYNQAAKEFERTKELDPKFPQVHLNLGNTYTLLGRLEEAVDEYMQALEQDLNNPRTYFNLGIVHHKLNQIEKAREAFQWAIKMDKNFARAYYELGLLYVKPPQQDLEQAKKNLQKYLELDPKGSYAEPALSVYKQIEQIEKTKKPG